MGGYIEDTIQKRPTTKQVRDENIKIYYGSYVFDWSGGAYLFWRS